MNRAWIGTAVAVVIISTADAASIQRNVRSGTPVLVWTYRNVDAYCNDMPGTVKVVTRPAHGRISQHAVRSPMTGVRFGSARCVGQVSTGLEVRYQSVSGFRGIDTFTLEADWAANNRHETDTFTMEVQ